MNERLGSIIRKQSNLLISVLAQQEEMAKTLAAFKSVKDNSTYKQTRITTSREFTNPEFPARAKKRRSNSQDNKSRSTIMFEFDA